jgi:REP element-mobilizing transposase RayT
LFGTIDDGEMILNEHGKVVKREWLNTFDIRQNIELDEYVIMPNHFHGIITIACRGTLQRARKDVPNEHARTVERFGKPVSNSIPTIIRLFKSAVTKQINHIRNTPGCPVWHRNFYERVIRNEKELFQTREYIQNNPLQWDLDKENPLNANPAL